MNPAPSKYSKNYKFTMNKKVWDKREGAG